MKLLRYPRTFSKNIKCWHNTKEDINLATNFLEGCEIKKQNLVTYTFIERNWETPTDLPLQNHIKFILNNHAKP